MKKLFIFILLASFSMAGSAQDDDVYFVPSKKKSKTVKVDTDDDPYAEGVGRRIGDFPDPLGGAPLENESGTGLRDVDEYNRRPNTAAPQPADTTYADEEEWAMDDADGTYTSRIVRFHSPRAGVYVSSPYYIDFYDIYYDPWYTPAWAYGLGFGIGWSSWWWYDRWAWSPYYCYDPWWGHHYHGWYPPHHHHDWVPARPSNGGFAAHGLRGTRSSNRGAGLYPSSRPTAGNLGLRNNSRGTRGTVSTTGATGSTPSRSGNLNLRGGRSVNRTVTTPAGNSNQSTRTTRSGNLGNRSINNNSSRSFSTPSTPSRSSSSSSFSTPSRSSGFSGGSRGGFSGGSRGGFSGGSRGGRR